MTGVRLEWLAGVVRDAIYEEGEYAPDVIAHAVLDALRNPTDELVEELTAVVSHWLVYEQGDYHRDLMVRAVLAALAGGGDG